MDAFTTDRDKSRWNRTMMILVPDWAPAGDDRVRDDGLRLTGTHHEISLSDPRRTRPDHLRTILRQPVARDGSPVGD